MRELVKLSSTDMYESVQPIDKREFISIQKCGVDGYKWQHGVAMAYYGGKFYALWGRNKGLENTVGEEGVVFSSDDCREWSYMQSFVADEGFAYSHGCLFEASGRLYAMLPYYAGSDRQSPTGIRFKSLHMHGFILSGGAWERLDMDVLDFWPLQQAQRMQNGNYIMPGINGNWQAAVAISDGEDVTSWKVITLPYADGTAFTECNCIIDGDKITVYVRNERPTDTSCITAGVSYSYDCGETWSEVSESDLRAVTSKICSGTLSTGEKYLITNSIKGANYSRGALTVALTDKGCDIFNRMWLIRDRSIPSELKSVYHESEVNDGLSYPYAIEKDGLLYVSYSSARYGGNFNNIELCIIDINAFNRGV